jgi:hypothetical protein
LGCDNKTQLPFFTGIKILAEKTSIENFHCIPSYKYP